MARESKCHWEDCFGMPAVNEHLGLFPSTSSGSSSTPSRSSSTQGPKTPTLAGDDVPPMKVHGFHCAVAIWELKHAFKDRLSLLDTLVKTRHTQAEKPHDKLYGIMGLFANNIVPKYSMKITELWWSVSLRILRNEIENTERVLQNGDEPFHAFHYLSCIDHEVDGSGDIPSWAVDWSKSRATTSLAYNTSAVSCYNAGQSKVRRGLSIDQTGKILSLQAKVFENIAHLSPILENVDLKTVVSAAEDNAALKTCIAHAKMVPTKQQLEFLAFCKVVTAGKDGSRRQKYPPSSEDVATLRAPGRGEDVLQSSRSKKEPHGYNVILSFLSDAITGKKPTLQALALAS